MNRGRGVVVSTIMLLFGFAGICAAEPPAGTLEGWHVVRPGDTIEGITAHYLGSSQEWRENWRLNPSVKNPDLLFPGQRLRVILRPRSSAAAAQVNRLAQRVEARPEPHPWQDAALGELLLERDGVRTYARSSAELGFTDGSRLLVTENSLLFLRLPVRPHETTGRRGIEIVEGQADVELAAGAGKAPEVDVVIAGAKATMRAAPGGSSQSRSRRTAAASQVMVYRGEGAVEAAGARVALAEGTGTTVAPKAPPSPPEALLSAPVLVGPAAGFPLTAARVELAWQKVEKAAAYTLELCADPSCGQLVERRTDLTATSWRPGTDLAPAEYFWRVTAQAASGLDGYPAPTRLLTIVERDPDAEAPTGTLALRTPGVEVGGRRFVRGDTPLDLAVSDAGSGVTETTVLIDARPSNVAALGGPWAAGEHAVDVSVADRAGNVRRFERISFVADPDPPTIELRDVSSGGEGRKIWRELAELEFDATRGGWQGWRWISRDRFLRSDPPPLSWETDDTGKAIVLRASRAIELSGDLNRRLDAGQGVAIVFADAGCGVDRISLRLRGPRRADDPPRAERPLGLVLEAFDRLGNVRRAQLTVLEK